MKKLFVLATAAVLFGTGIVGCSNTSEGMKEDTAKNTAAVEKAADVAATKTVEGAEKAGVAMEKGAATAAVTTEKAAADATAATAKAVGDAGQAVKHTGKVMTVTPTVKAALLKDETLYPSGNATLNTINVDTGSDGQTIVLKGTVQTNDMKKHAEEVAKGAAPDATYKIDNQLTVVQH